ncbi:hypothetical protein N7493_004613 [Penicillium malachiteum]|uniref:Uncharacterized protein n=1 Tax=Penicillium malachiteum TaxID=1324776 RepID=A0AAD6HNX5_9EURO|nr:hypothetical protein N7493_004613 [Penicillium malachiteum]
MADENHVWTEVVDNSVEGHTKTATLWFKKKKLWTHGRHDNTSQLHNELHQLDDRFATTMDNKDKTIEGHTRKIYVRPNGQIILNGLSTHPSMDDMATIVNAILAVREYIP